MNHFLVYTKADANYIPTGVIPVSDYVKMAHMLQLVKCPWDSSKVCYKAIDAFTQQSCSGIGVIVRKGSVLMMT